MEVLIPPGVEIQLLSDPPAISCFECTAAIPPVITVVSGTCFTSRCGRIRINGAEAGHVVRRSSSFVIWNCNSFRGRIGVSVEGLSEIRIQIPAAELIFIVGIVLAVIHETGRRGDDFTVVHTEVHSLVIAPVDINTIRQLVHNIIGMEEYTILNLPELGIDRDAVIRHDGRFKGIQHRALFIHIPAFENEAVMTGGIVRLVIGSRRTILSARWAVRSNALFVIDIGRFHVIAKCREIQSIIVAVKIRAVAVNDGVLYAFVIELAGNWFVFRTAGSCSC